MDQPQPSNLPPAATLPHLPGLDGLRALALAAVLLYHAGVPWLPGGFLGVEVFFVLSGYLITTLLLREWDHSGGVDVRAFWLRRARRLVPAASALIVATLACYVVFLPGEVANLRGEALAAFCYALNWQLVLDHKPYFATFGRPSPLQHMWSLAVEAQFYLLWPAVVGHALRGGGRRAVLAIALVGAVASSVLMALLYQPGDDTARLYYGTDTRIGGVLLGAALACVCVPAQRRTTRWSWASDALGLGALGALGWLFYALDEFHPLLYLGGFAAVALVAAAAIAAVAFGSARRYDALLGWRPLRWLGQRSYSIYLWHWPVLSLAQPDLSLTGAPLLALQLGATLAAAELSYRLIEAPARRGRLGGWWRAARGLRPWRAAVGWAVAAAVVAGAVLLAGAVAGARQPTVPADVAALPDPGLEEPALSAALEKPALPATAGPANAAPVAVAPTVAVAPRVPRASATPGEADTARADTHVLASSRASPVPTPTPSPLPAPTTTAVPMSIIAIGDSVMLGAAKNLVQAVGAIEVDAKVGRQVKAAIVLLRQRYSAGQLGDVVVIHMGDNGPFSAQQFDELMQVVGDTRKVVFVNVKVPRRWEGPNNSVISAGVQSHPNAVLVDWHTASVGRPELFGRDGIHLRPEGCRVYALLIADRLRALQARQ